MKKRLFGIALMLTLAVAVICFGTTKAEAASSHTHPVCGSTCRCSGDTHYSSTWQAWDGTTKMYSGDYYLTKDVVLTKTMILDYSYTTRLCLNGYSITCEDRVFDIYSYRSLLISDCVGTGKVVSTNADCTIGNNKYLSIWGGTITNTTDGYGSAAIHANGNTTTYICGGTVDGGDCDGIYAYPSSKVFIQGGTIRAGRQGSGLSGHGTVNNTLGQVTMSGGTVICSNTGYAALDVQDGNFTMTGGKVSGDLFISDERGATNITGGTINGMLHTDSDTITVSGGSIQSAYLYGNITVSAGTFGGKCMLIGDNVTVSGGDFSACDSITVNGKSWICGGLFSKLEILNTQLYLSGVPKIATLSARMPGLINAQSLDGSGSFGGDTVEVVLSSEVTTWKDGDIVIKNVKSDAVAGKFRLAGEDAQWMYLERVNNNLVLRIIPHGTWGNATWSVMDGKLTISGTGALKYTYSGNQYPWGGYQSQIREIVVEPGITEIPSYTFEYCAKATKISLPETLTHLALNAFNDCSSLNNLLLPASLTKISGTSNTGRPAFIRCGALTDVYYRGTAEQWANVQNASRVESHNSEMTLHFLQLQETTATCIQAGIAPHYRFDDTSVYGDLYDLDMQPISQPAQVPALGHRLENGTDPEIAMPDCTNAVICDYCGFEIKAALGHDLIYHAGKTPDVGEIGWEPYETCSRCDYTTYVELPALVLTPNINCDDKVDNADVLLLLWHTLFAEANPVTVDCDLNRDGYVDNADVLLLLWHTLFPEENPIG